MKIWGTYALPAWYILAKSCQPLDYIIRYDFVSSDSVGGYIKLIISSQLVLDFLDAVVVTSVDARKNKTTPSTADYRNSSNFSNCKNSSNEFEHHFSAKFLEYKTF